MQNPINIEPIYNLADFIKIVTFSKLSIFELHFFHISAKGNFNKGIKLKTT